MRNISVTQKLLGDPTPAKTSGLAYTLATLLSMVLSFVFLLVVTASGAANDPAYADSNWYLYCSYILPQLSFGIVAIWCLRYIGGPLRETVKGQKCSFKYYVIAVILQVGLLSLSELNNIFLAFLERFGYKDQGIALPSMDGIGFVGVLLVVAVLPAIFEELLFRGVLLKGLKCFGQTGAILICGILFSLYHQNPAQTLYQFCCGAAFALVAIRSGSILPTVLSHFINNAVILILAKLGLGSFSTPVFVTLMIVSAVCLIGSLCYLVFADKKGNAADVSNETGERKRFFMYASVGIAVCVFMWLAVLLSGM